MSQYFVAPQTSACLHLHAGARTLQTRIAAAPFIQVKQGVVAFDSGPSRTTAFSQTEHTPHKRMQKKVTTAYSASSKSA